VPIQPPASPSPDSGPNVHGREPLRELGYLVLLALLAALFVLTALPFAEEAWLRTTLRIVYATILVTTLVAAARSRVGVGVGLSLVALFGAATLAGPAFALAANGLAVAFFLFFIAVLLKDVFSHRRVTVSTVSGAICAYVFLGLLWTFVYELIAGLDESAFHGLTHARSAIRDDLFYFSFVTLTTVGYGDIVPVTDPARVMAILEAMVGQLFLVVLLARIVSVWAATPDVAPE